MNPNPKAPTGPSPTASAPLTAQQAAQQGSPPPRSIWGYVTSFGPGVVIALTWLGTGDLIGDIVAGASYGYALLWALALSLIIRFLFVNALARYPIYNIQRDTSLVRGFTRLHPAFAVLILIAFIGYVHILGAYLFSGAGDALYALTGHSLSKFIWAAVTAVSVFVVCRWGGFKSLEKVFTALLVVMMAGLLFGVARVGVNWPELAQGLVYSTPPQEGLLDSSLIVAGLMLATTGSILNFVYPQFLQEKGWVTPSHRKVQQYDLLFGILVVMVLGAAVWVIGAEVLYGQGSVTDTDTIASGLAGAIGPAGRYIFYLGLLGAAWTSIAGATFALSKMSVECIHLLRPSRAEKYTNPTKDPVHVAVVLFACAAAVWSLPFAPSFVILTIALSALSAPFLIGMVGGLLVLLNRKSLMGSHTNNWWQNAILVLVLGLVTVAGYRGIHEAINILTGT